MHDVQRAPSARCPSRGPCDEVVFKLTQRNSCHFRYTTSRHGGRSSRRRGPRGAVQTRRRGRGVLGIQGCHHKQGHHRGEIFPSRFSAQQNKRRTRNPWIPFDTYDNGPSLHVERYAKKFLLHYPRHVCCALISSKSNKFFFYSFHFCPPQHLFRSAPRRHRLTFQHRMLCSCSPSFSRCCGCGSP